MNYGDLIKDSLGITLRNRYLWFFGFFAGGTGGCGAPGGTGGGFEDGDPGPPQNLPDLSSATALQIGPDSFGSVVLVAAVVVLALTVALGLIALSTISRGGLANSVAAIERGERRSFGSTWRAGTSRFWRVLGYLIVFILISLALLLAILLPALLTVLGVFSATDSLGARVAVGVLVAFAVIGLLVLLFIPLSIIGQYALREVAVRDGRVFASIGSGYRLFRRNVGRSLLVWLIQLGLMIALGLALIVVLLLIGLLLFAPAIGLAIAELRAAATAAAVIAGLILLPVLLLATAALNTFNHAYWTLAYLRLEPPPAQSVPVSSGYGA